MVFYRKYRPQSLSQLIGQANVKKILEQAIKTDRLSHAYLFCGPRGTGKTSTARILAKIVNCENPSGEDFACSKCSSCLSITDGSSLDLIEIDAASNRGIDDIRDLRERIKLAPTASKKKIYIIDEVHMLTTEAFNALLKTLEEPPAHVLFILATTEVHKVPATILSRVQRLDFQLASEAELLQALQKVVDAEGIRAEEKALQFLAKKADGSFRDALKLLDQVGSEKNEITFEQVETLFNSGKNEDVVSLLEEISKKDGKKALELLVKQTSTGINIRDYLLQIMDTLRILLFLKYGIKPTSLDQITSSYGKNLENLSNLFSRDQLIRTLTHFQTALEKIRVTSVPTLPLEIAVLEACQVLNEVKEGLTINSVEIKNQVTPAVVASIEQVENIKAVEVTVEKGVENAKVDNSPDLLKLLDKWNYILETIKPYNYSLEAMLKQVKLLSCDDGQVLLEVPYSFHQRILEAPKSRDLLESVLADVLEKSIKVRCVLGNRPIRVEEIANIEIAADDEVVRLAAEIFNS